MKDHKNEMIQLLIAKDQSTNYTEVNPIQNEIAFLNSQIGKLLLDLQFPQPADLRAYRWKQLRRLIAMRYR